MIFTIVFSALLSVNANCYEPVPQQDTTVQGGTLIESYIQSYRRPAIGVKRLGSEQFRMAPSMLGETDILKTVQMLPGISGGKEGNAGVMIRGGNYDQPVIYNVCIMPFRPALTYSLRF